MILDTVTHLGLGFNLEHMNVVFRKADDTNSVTIKDEEMQNNNPIDNVLDILDKVHYTA